MALDEVYCKSREEYCLAVERVIDKLGKIKRDILREGLKMSEEFKQSVIKATGTPPPPGNFEDIWCVR